MKKHFWQQILVPLVLVFAILICGTSNVLGKYAGTNGFHLLASVEFGDTKNSDAYIVVLNKGEEPTDEKIFVYPDGDPSTSIWGAGDPNADSYMTYGWNNAEELIFTVENRTENPVKIEVVIRMALPLMYGDSIWTIGDPLEFRMPYTLSEVCLKEGTSASSDKYLVSDTDASDSNFSNSYYFTKITSAWESVFKPLYAIESHHYVEFEVTIQTELILKDTHTHTYQFNFGVPTEVEGGGGLDDIKLLDYASYKSIQIKAVSQ